MMSGQAHENIIYDVGWADEFIRKAKPYIYVREKDRLLIMIPNQAYRLNETGVRILKFLLAGNPVADLLTIVGDTPKKREELHYFFCDLRAAVSGCLREYEKREAIFYYEFDGEFSEYPVLSEIAVTYRCNLKCNFCYVGSKKYGELNTADTKKVLYKIRYEAEVPSVSFTGGEPMLRSDIMDLVRYAVDIGLWTNLITNGTLLDVRKVMQLKHAGLSSAQVSIEGPVARVHDDITGVKGSFDATVQGIKNLKTAGISVHTNTTISRKNLDHLEEIVILTKNLGLTRLSMNLISPCGMALKNRDIWVSYSEIGEHILKVKHRADQEGIEFLWYSPVPMCKFNPISYGFGNKSCAAITGLLSIDPMGNILPCSSWPWSVASLLKKHFKDIWQMPMLSYFRNKEYAPKQCRECPYFDICKGACPLYWKAWGLEELNGRK